MKKKLFNKRIYFQNYQTKVIIISTINLNNKTSDKINTYYLNSLIQSMFMTPEFLKNLLATNLDDQKNSVLFQLKKLFQRLQLNQNDYESIDDLIKSKYKTKYN